MDATERLEGTLRQELRVLAGQRAKCFGTKRINELQLMGEQYSRCKCPNLTRLVLQAICEDLLPSAPDVYEVGTDQHH